MLYSSTIQIQASPERVWELLIDAKAWPEWEPNCTKIDGDIKLGEKLTVHTKLSDQAFPANVTAMDAPNSMIWSWSTRPLVDFVAVPLTCSPLLMRSMTALPTMPSRAFKAVGRSTLALRA